MEYGGGDEFLRGPDGEIMKDRYGRPIRRRHTPRPEQPEQMTRFDPRPVQPMQPVQQAQPIQPAPPQYVPPAQPQYVSPVQQPPAAPAPQKRRRRHPFLRRLGIICSILVILFVGALVWVDMGLNRVEALTNYSGRPSGGSGTNWLLVGSDSRQGLSEKEQSELHTGGDTGGGRTDSIMVVHIPLAGKATILSIPRDSYVNIPGYGKNKINAAFSFGGPQLLQKTVEQATGIHIDHYAEIGFGGFAGIVDAIGGVNICVDQAMNDEYAGINLQPGCQDMDGKTALGFVRSRYALADGDIGRARNQRAFLSAIMKKAASPSTWLNPFRMLPLLSKAKVSFTVNKKDHVWHLARLGIALASGPNTESVPVGSYASVDVGSVIIWDDARAQEIFNKLK